MKLNQEKLKDEIDVKNRFFTIISHDLNSPYSQLLGFTSVLANEAGNLSKEEIINYANKVNSAALRVFNLQKNLLEWSSSQFIKGNVELKTIFLNEVVQESIRHFELIGESKNVTMINNISESKVIADPNMIQTIVRNLISNAMKFSHPGGQIVLSSEKKDGMVQVVVSDSGIGISKEKIEKNFELDNLKSGVGTAGEKGTGIGMTLCREMIEKNGGNIWVDSVIGEGTQVYFNLPTE